MAWEMREGQGSLFRNEGRTEGSNQPNARGTALIGGVLYEVSAWTKEGAKGKFQSLSFKPKGERAAQQAKPEPTPKPGGHFDDMPNDLPF